MKGKLIAAAVSVIMIFCSGCSAADNDDGTDKMSASSSYAEIPSTPEDQPQQKRKIIGPVSTVHTKNLMTEKMS